VSERSHTKLEVWRRSISMVAQVYRITKDYPTEERYGLMSQMRRAAVSVPSNIAEGAARKSTKEYVRFLYNARGSLSELDAQIEISRNLGYLKKEKYKCIIDELNEISRMLSGLINSLGRRK